MRVRRTIRKTAKWGGAVTCVALLAGFIASTRWTVCWIISEGACVAAGAGRVSLGWPRGDGPAIMILIDPGLHVIEHGEPELTDVAFWWPLFFASKAVDWIGGSVHLVLILALAASTTTAVWRIDSLARRRQHAGRCGCCGYHRTGLPADAACPECGTASGTGS